MVATISRIVRNAVALFAALTLFSFFRPPISAPVEAVQERTRERQAKVYLGENYSYVELDGDLYAVKQEKVSLDDGGRLWYHFSMRKVQ